MPDKVPLSERIERDFPYHAPNEDQAPDEEKQIKHMQIRGLARDFAVTMAEIIPESRELSLAISRLEEVVFWANAAIARNA